MVDPQITQFLELLSDPRYAMLFLLLTMWSLAWKGVALWRASHNNQRNWFIVMLIVNTVGILEIVYIFYFSKVKSTQAPQ
jgi:hypothetical protein